MRCLNVREVYYAKSHTLDLLRRVVTKSEKFINAALFLRLGLTCILIRHENGTFRKRFPNRRNLKMPTFRFSVEGKRFKNRAFQKPWRQDNYVISLTQFSSNSTPKCPVIGAFLNQSSGVAWTESI